MTRSEDVETQADDLIDELEKMRNFNPSEKILLRQMREGASGCVWLYHDAPPAISATQEAVHI